MSGKMLWMTQGALRAATVAARRRDQATSLRLARVAAGAAGHLVRRAAVVGEAAAAGVAAGVTAWRAPRAARVAAGAVWQKSLARVAVGAAGHLVSGAAEMLAREVGQVRGAGIAAAAVGGRSADRVATGAVARTMGHVAGGAVGGAVGAPFHVATHRGETDVLAGTAPGLGAVVAPPRRATPDMSRVVGDPPRGTRLYTSTADAPPGRKTTPGLGTAGDSGGSVGDHTDLWGILACVAQQPCPRQ